MQRNYKTSSNKMTRIIFKKIYDEVKEDMFDMSNVSIFNESKKKKKHFFLGWVGGVDLYFVMSSAS